MFDVKRATIPIKGFPRTVMILELPYIVTKYIYSFLGILIYQLSYWK